MIRGYIYAGIVGTAVLAACDLGLTTPDPPPTISISPSTTSVSVNEGRMLSVVYSDPGDPQGERPPITWQSLDPEIASVSDRGLVVGRRPGNARVVARADRAADTAMVAVERTPLTIRVDPKPSRLFPGDTLRLSATVYDTEGVEMSGQTIAWESSDTAVATIDTSGLLTARDDGTASVLARVSPALGTEQVVVRTLQCGETGPTLRLAPGESRTFSGATFLCLAGDLAKYAVVAHNAHDSGDLTLEVEGSGGFSTRPLDLSLSLAPSTRLLRSGLSRSLEPDHAFERELRERERRQLSGLMGFRRSPRATATLLADHIPDTGELLELNVSASCSEPDLRIGRVKATSEHAIIIADTANPKWGTSESEYVHIAHEFDAHAYSPARQAFGEPTDLDGNGKIIIFYTRAVNELTPANSGSFVGGFMWAGDLFPRSECASSNYGEIFYMQVADREGEVNGNEVDPYWLRDRTVGVAAHELQHVINAGRRIYVNAATSLEEVWLNEGLSHVAEELAFYRASGLAPGQDISLQTLQTSPQLIAAANRYAVANLARLALYLRDPEGHSPFQGDDELETRGAIWQFLRYAADRKGGDQDAFWYSLVNATSTGRSNLRDALGADPAAWAHESQVAQWLDIPKVPTRTTEGRFLHPSWDYRSLVSALTGSGFPLRWHSLQRGAELSLTLVPAGAAYFSGAVNSGESAGIRFTHGGEPPPATFRVTVVGLAK